VPELRVNLDTISRNTAAVASLLRAIGVDLVGVTKGCVGEPRVAAAMLAGGAVALADTRDLNLARLRAALPAAELHRIHLPSVTEPFDPADLCYVSSAAGAAAVAALGPAGAPAPGAAALRRFSGAPRRVMIQVETGDQREGVPVEQLLDLAAVIAADPRLTLEGVGTNYACFKGEPYGIDASVEGVARGARALRGAGYEIHRVSGCPAGTRACSGTSDRMRCCRLRSQNCDAGRPSSWATTPSSTSPCRAAGGMPAFSGPKCSSGILRPFRRGRPRGSSSASDGRT
jgi:predicted amino acid racemase